MDRVRVDATAMGPGSGAPRRPSRDGRAHAGAAVSSAGVSSGQTAARGSAGGEARSIVVGGGEVATAVTLSVLVVLPTYQEAENVAEVIRRVRASTPEAEILVIDDSSPDGTADVAKAAGHELGAVEIMVRPAKSGLGSAYRTGFGLGCQRGYDVLVEMDSDLSHDPASLRSLLDAVADGADLAIGSRYVPGGAIPNWPARRRALSRLGNRYATAMLRMKLTDSTSGFRAYRASALDRIDLDEVRADGYGFQIEMAYRILSGGGRVEERPIVFRDRERGTSKMSMRIIVEALWLVTSWGIRLRLRGKAL